MEKIKKINLEGRDIYVLSQNVSGTEFQKYLFNEIFEKIKQIAINNPDGFTVQLPKCEYVTSGYVASYAATQNGFGKKGLERAIKHALNHNRVVGGWYNKENDKYYFDSDIVFSNLNDALEFASEQGQMCIFDLYNQKEIFVNEFAPAY